jgi:hypothetical protein
VTAMWLGRILTVSSIVVSLAGTANAQCASDACNQRGEYWDFKGASDTQAGEQHGIRIGMYFNGTGYNPAVCKDSITLITARTYEFPRPMLFDDASVCLGSGAESVTFVPAATVESCGQQIIYGFGGNGFTFTLTGGAGRDNITGPAFKANLCGGGDNDYVAGGLDYQYVSGGKGNDSISGGASNDNVRGNAGNDRIDHSSTNQAGTDQLRGETGDDCSQASKPVASGSSCGDGNDTWSGTRLASDCETNVSGCPLI